MDEMKLSHGVALVKSVISNNSSSSSDILVLCNFKSVCH
jgi:hypothetical protein